MRRRQPLKRVKGLEPRLEQIQAWQRRTQEAAAASGRTTRRREQRRRQKRNDSAWRAACIEARGDACRACGSSQHVEMDHVIERKQGGPSIVENALPLCGDWGPCRAHPRKTRNELQIQRAWLDPDMIEWLDREGHARWLPDGSVEGTYWTTFAPLAEGDQ